MKAIHFQGRTFQDYQVLKLELQKPTFLIPSLARICLYPWCLFVSVWGKSSCITNMDLSVFHFSKPGSVGKATPCSQSRADYKAPWEECVKRVVMTFQYGKIIPVHSLWPLKHSRILLLLFLLFVCIDDGVLGDGSLLGRQAHDVPHICSTSHPGKTNMRLWNKHSLNSISYSFTLVFWHEHLLHSLESAPIQHLLHFVQGCPLEVFQWLLFQKNFRNHKTNMDQVQLLFTLP